MCPCPIFCVLYRSECPSQRYVSLQCSRKKILFLLDCGLCGVGIRGLWGGTPLGEATSQEVGLNQQACFRARVPIRHWESLRVAFPLFQTLLSPAALLIPRKLHSSLLGSGQGPEHWESESGPAESLHINRRGTKSEPTFTEHIYTQGTVPISL